MLNAITWQEILRQLMSKDLGIDPSIGHVEPLVGCEIVRQTLYMQNNSTPFNAPVDTSVKGLEDYPQVIKNPMDLGTIKKKIDSGGYEGPDGYVMFAEDIRLVWDNAVLYNGEESEIGRAALALSDVFEQDYERLVAGRGIKRRHEFIGKFFEDIQAEKIEDEKNLEQEKKIQAEEMTSELSSLVIRESPLGKDRYHNSYYMFKHDTKARLFVERGDTGDFVVCTSKDQLMGILEWLNPKGVRELDLLTKLREVKEKLLSAFEESGKQEGDTAEIVWNTNGSIELQMFPLPGGAIKSDTMTITDADKVIKSYSIARKMLVCLKQHLENTNTLPASWEDQEFPQYKEIILHPMDLGQMTEKASNLEYNTSAEFMTDLRLMRDNCQLFCEGRFPTLPPLAHNLVYVADGQIKKWGKEIRACEGTSEATKGDTLSPDKKGISKQDESEPEHSELSTRSIVTILRLENRLPEYIVDISRYSWAVNREYYGGVTAGSLPFDVHGMLPWESLRITWDEDDGSDDNRINPWEAEFTRGGNRA
ncbi:hypothetical protein PHMEG_0001675 [Phytophthora megakarya]|uniref:Bromo domain-containing protein n=1 Tax=Phytophthora megakarya TaxID=4795 RepID=A0A225X2M0_9STRA|nr:hypothetical protein PHMEG_0001675 [Phytophthora megakarya]